MKSVKKLIVLATFITLLSLLGCNAKADKKAWTVEDFAIYDSDGKLFNYPKGDLIHLSYYRDEDKKYQTKRGVKLYDHAKVALSNYDLTDFYFSGDCYPVLRSTNDKEKEISQKYKEKYPDVNEAVKHTDELEYNKMSLYVYGVFIEKDGKLIQVELDEKGIPIDDNKQERYSISFYIKDDEIFDISFSNNGINLN
jgi:hypothetical protein